MAGDPLRLLLIVFHDIFQCVIKGILTEKLTQIVTTFLPDVVQYLCDYHEYGTDRAVEFATSDAR